MRLQRFALEPLFFFCPSYAAGMNTSLSAGGDEPVPLTRSELARVLVAGVLLPISVVLFMWIVASSWDDLPSSFPAHWGKDGVDNFVPPQTYINTQACAAGVAALVSTGIAVGNLLSGSWSPLSRGFTAVAVGVTASIALGFFVQLLRARGLSTAEVIDLGGGAGIAGVGGGFAAFLTVAVLALPRGEYR